MAGVSLEAVWKMGATLPGVVQSTAYGSPALKVGGQLMACVPTNKSAEPGSLMFRVDRNDRQTMLAEAPELSTSRTTISPTMRCWCDWSG